MYSDWIDNIRVVSDKGQGIYSPLYDEEIKLKNDSDIALSDDYLFLHMPQCMDEIWS